MHIKQLNLKKFHWELLTVINGNIHLHTRFNTYASDLLYNITRGMQINQPLVNAHLELIPRVGTLSAGSLTGGNRQAFGGKTDRSRDIELLVGGTLLQVSAHLFEVLHVARGEGDADAVHLGTGIFEASFFLSRWHKGRHGSKGFCVGGKMFTSDCESGIRIRVSDVIMIRMKNTTYR